MKSLPAAPPLRYNRIDELAGIDAPVVLAVGVFDGLHLGHRAVIDRARQLAVEREAELVVTTFDPHPVKVLRPDRAPRLLVNTAHKLLLLAEAGVKRVLVVPFDTTFCHMPAAEFVLQLVAAGRPLRGIVVGEEWRFGHERAGDLALLRSLGKAHHFAVAGVPALQVDGAVVSSTRIRELVTVGDLDGAERLLGRRFSVFGTVVEGDHVGTKLGYPTANVKVGGEQFPPHGVYATRARINGIWHVSVTNLGRRPTVADDSGQPLLETHLLDYAGNLYGEMIEVRFDAFLRQEQKFASLDALRSQIGEDVTHAQRVGENLR